MLIEKQKFPHKTVSLHDSMPELLFRYRRAVSLKFRDSLGNYGIDHISIDIINPRNEMITFSSTPTMMYNLITSGLWKYDGALSPTYYKKLPFFLWENAYPQDYAKELRRIKETEHALHGGFTLVRHIFSHYLLYSFATKDHSIEWTPYEDHLDELLMIGDYSYKLIKKIYKLISKPYVPPSINIFIPFEAGKPKDLGEVASNQRLNLLIDNEQ